MKSKDTFNTLNVVTTAMLAALAVILGSVVHMLVDGNMTLASLFSPMHFPVLLAGILCGPWLGLICGALTPWISFLANGRPPFPNALLPMFVELAIYGFLTGMMRRVFLKNSKTNRFASILALIIAMVAGRLANAIVGAIFLASPEYSYFVALFAKFLDNFTATWAAIVIQLVFIPAILFALQKSGVLLKYLPDTPTAKQAVASAEAADTTVNDEKISKQTNTADSQERFTRK